jgi:hypothetical protein
MLLQIAIELLDASSASCATVAPRPAFAPCWRGAIVDCDVLTNLDLSAAASQSDVLRASLSLHRPKMLARKIPRSFCENARAVARDIAQFEEGLQWRTLSACATICRGRDRDR